MPSIFSLEIVEGTDGNKNREGFIDFKRKAAPDTGTSRYTPEVETYSCPVPYAQFCILISRAPYDISLQRRRFLGGAQVLNNLPEDDRDNWHRYY